MGKVADRLGRGVPGGLGNRLCIAPLTGQVRQVWRIDHWTSSTHMMVTLTGVILGTKMTAGDSGESGKGVIRVVNSFACKMGSSWRYLPAEAFYSGGNDPGGGHWPVGVHEVARGKGFWAEGKGGP